MTESPYQAIKRCIADGIASGNFVPGQVLPSEHELCRSFGVARMTVNRAMRELATENLVRRVPGVGTFVAEPIAQSGLVEIRNIADEIKARGHTHRSQVFALDAVVPPGSVADAFDLAAGATLYHSEVLHFENDVRSSSRTA
ncbi:MAG: GntR family transcriptional regulator [Rhodospirillales bacterium]